MRKSLLDSRVFCFLRNALVLLFYHIRYILPSYCEWFFEQTLLLNFISLHDKMFFLKIPNTLKAVAKFTEVIYFWIFPGSGNRHSVCSIASFVQVQMVCQILTLVFVFQLVSEKKIDKNLLPPKKIIGKNSKSLVEKRQKELEIYLQTLLLKFPVTAPKVLSHFLHFHLYVSYVFGVWIEAWVSFPSSLTWREFCGIFMNSLKWFFFNILHNITKHIFKVFDTTFYCSRHCAGK